MAYTESQMSSPQAHCKTIHLQYQKAKAILDSQAKTPKFLFRGFCPDSGGGSDPRLNGELGIVPHAFLAGKRPTTIFDIPNLQFMIEEHLSMGHLETEFSSWSANFEVALGFAGDEGRVAILDTDQLPENVAVYHSPDLKTAGLIDISYFDEYLIYGPVNGPGYHSVAVSSIYEAGFSDINDSHCENIYDPLLTADDLANAKRVAQLFQTPSRPRPDIRIFMTAVMLSIRLWYCRLDGGLKVHDRDAAAFVAHVADDIISFSTSSSVHDGILFANRAMDTSAGSGLLEMLYLLDAAEHEIRYQWSLKPSTEPDSLSSQQTGLKWVGGYEWLQRLYCASLRYTIFFGWAGYRGWVEYR
ncbi:hypothetical protein AB5N19_07039 [Seiridium cardinale]